MTHLLLLRLPAKMESLEQFKEYKNETGLCSPVMVDLQKVLVCIDMFTMEKEKAKVDKKYIAHVAGCEFFSSKTNDAISAPPDWRQDQKGWEAIAVL